MSQEITKSKIVSCWIDRWPVGVNNALQTLYSLRARKSAKKAVLWLTVTNIQTKQLVVFVLMDSIWLEMSVLKLQMIAIVLTKLMESATNAIQITN